MIDAKTEKGNIKNQKTEEGNEIIKIEGLWKYFDGRAVLKDINISIPRGKITVVMGRSGCGKTVLVKHIVGLLRPDKGKIYFNGKDITSLGKSELERFRKNFGFLFQNSALFDWMTVEENIAFPLYEVKKMKNKSEIKKKLDPILDIIGLKGHERKYPSELSGGMQKRTALARAVISEPEVVILDEPTSGIDPATSFSIEDLILKLKKKVGSTFIVITHDIKSALRLADKIIFMQNGKVIWQGLPQEIKNVEHEEVKTFLRRLEI